MRVRNKKKQYRVKWKGYDEDVNTWEPLENLKSSKEMVARYEKIQKGEMLPSTLEDAKIRVVTSITSETPKEIIEIFRPCILKSRAEDGCVQYDLVQGYHKVKRQCSEGTFRVIEAWKNEEALTCHRESRHYKALQKALNECEDVNLAPEGDYKCVM